MDVPKQIPAPGELLKLDNQLCFALYVCSKEIIRKYRPLLKPLGLTYTGYITMLALWERADITVKELGTELYLDSGTLTPVLKKLEAAGYVERMRGTDNERNVYIRLTGEGQRLKERTAEVPLRLLELTGCGLNDSSRLLLSLRKLMELLTKDTQSR